MSQFQSEDSKSSHLHECQTEGEINVMLEVRMTIRCSFQKGSPGGGGARVLVLFLSTQGVLT